jgi:class 3 adenylate cyclase
MLWHSKIKYNGFVWKPLKIFLESFLGWAMEIKSGSKGSITKKILGLPLRFKISVPYLIVASLFTGLAIFMIGRSLVSTLEDRFRRQLEEAYFRAIDEVINIESGHLQMFRTISFTVGVPDALASQDAQRLNELIFPQIVNNQLNNVDVLDETGRSIISWRLLEGTSEYVSSTEKQQFDWDVVRTVVAADYDEQGDKFVQFVDTPQGLILYTAGPIRTEESQLGILLIGTPISKITQVLALSSLANITFYDETGFVSYSSFGDRNISSLSAEILGDLPGVETALFTRNIEVNNRNYIEAIETLYLRGDPSTWSLGVALSESLVRDAQGNTAWQLLSTFFIGILALIGLGVVVTQMIAQPIAKLVDASHEVGAGNLDVQVDIQTQDEIGTLAQGFNQMVVGLQQREYINEMFGRMVSEDVREAVLQNQLSLGGNTHEVTALFTDVRGFTSLTEQESPEDIINLLNEFFIIVTTATQKYHGTVNHFGGDSVLAVFGAPIIRPIKDTVRYAVLAAIEIFRNGMELNAKRISAGNLPVRFGIGINSGPVVAGNIGSEDRFTYTVIGDVVNTAARLQGISREFPITPVLIPQFCLDLLGEDFEIDYMYLNDFSLRGKAESIATHAVLGSRKKIPESFSVFSETQYSYHLALLGCYLCCRGYNPETIGSAMQIAPHYIEKWINEARVDFKTLQPILIQQFGLKVADTLRLLEEKTNEQEI